MPPNMDPLGDDMRGKLEKIKSSANALMGIAVMLCCSGCLPCICIPPWCVCCCMPCCWCCVWPASCIIGNSAQKAGQIGRGTSLSHTSPMDQSGLSDLRRSFQGFSTAAKMVVGCVIPMTCWGMVWSILWFMGGLSIWWGAIGNPLFPIKVVDTTDKLSLIDITGGEIVYMGRTGGTSVIGDINSITGNEKKVPKGLVDRPFLVPTEDSGGSILSKTVMYNGFRYVHWLSGRMTFGYVTMSQYSMSASTPVATITTTTTAAPAVPSNTDTTVATTATDSTTTSGGNSTRILSDMSLIETNNRRRDLFIVDNTNKFGTGPLCFVVPFLEEGAPLILNECNKEVGVGYVAKNYGENPNKHTFFLRWYADQENPVLAWGSLPNEDTDGSEKGDWEIAQCTSGADSAKVVGPFGLLNDYYCIKAVQEKGKKTDGKVSFKVSPTPELTTDGTFLFTALMVLFFWFLAMPGVDSIVIGQYRVLSDIDKGLQAAQVKITDMQQQQMMNVGEYGQGGMMMGMGGMQQMGGMQGMGMQPMGMQPMGGGMAMQPMNGGMMMMQPMQVQTVVGAPMPITNEATPLN